MISEEEQLWSLGLLHPPRLHVSTPPGAFLPTLSSPVEEAQQHGFHSQEASSWRGRCQLTFLQLDLSMVEGEHSYPLTINSESYKPLPLSLLCSIFLHRDCKMVTPLGKTVGQCFQMLNTALPCDLAHPLLGIYPEKKMVTYVHTTTGTRVFTLASFIKSKMGNNLNVHQLVNE